MPKGSFYYFFDSKESLALAVIDEHWAGQKRTWATALGGDTQHGDAQRRDAQRGDAQPLLRLRRLFEETEVGLRTAQQSCGTVSGCLFGNLTLEMSNQTEAIRTRLQEIFEAQVEMVDSVIAEALERQEVEVADTQEAARAVVAQLEGQVLFAKLYNSTQQLGPLWANCLALLGAHAPRETAAGV
ncbi:TetR family transcriptional regulator [Streptomyces bingchenggensis BCW-1]|uniref:TetR family transcriptional regulator n=1 Tax=Streptomyces bingchenggensis (strain BCW-1) TaxID=749414 RepID=D7BYM8_STRBB|nr:TetR family transcriptional regulator [Streptomyces bingchenggensis BCW-1]